MSRASRFRRAAGALLLAAAVLPLAPAGPAAADTAPPVAGTPPTAAADVLPTVQINGVVWAQVVVGNTVYATGEFTSARPAGAAAGTNETPRSYLLAYDITTGDLVTGFAPALNAQGRALAASPDGQTIYVGGSFTSVNGVRRNRVAALDATTGALKPQFATGTDATVNTLAVSGDALYLGGKFGVAGGQARGKLAAYSTTTGALLPWAPTANAEVLAMTAPANTSKIVVGGRFTTLNGTANYGMGALDAGTAAVLPWAVNGVVRNAGANAAIYSLRSAGTQVFGTGYTFGTGGNFENTFSASADTGALTWVSGCLGDTYDAAPLGDVVYIVGHAHNCSQVGNFPEQTPRTWQRALAYRLAPAPDGRTVQNGNFTGRPAPEVLHFQPTLDAGTYTGQDQAAWSVTGNADYVVFGGEFPAINGVPQQGLARMAVRAIAPNQEGLQGFATLTPTLTTLANNVVRASWTSGWDRDNERLTYELLRGATAGTSTVVASTTMDNSSWWNRQSLGLLDTTAPAGSTQTYRVRVKDPLGNTAVSAATTATIPATAAPASPYRDMVFADEPLKYWRLDEPAGTTASDYAGAANLTLTAVAARNVAGALAGDTDTATTFPGFGTVPGTTTGTSVLGPQTFSLEAWFRTSVGGGKIIGFGNSATGASSSADRQIYLNNAGLLTFGVNPGAVKTVSSTATYLDNRWHHVVGTLDASGLKLYVDGALVGSRADVVQALDQNGYWRVGGDAIATTWPNRPVNSAFTGQLDEVAVYGKALGADRVAAHFQRGTSAANAAPTASFTATPTDLTAAFDASASADTDGTITTYAWDFGDGTTGTGKTVSHTYAAAGTYPVALTVTDNGSATGQASNTVTVTAPDAGTAFAADAFDRTVATGFGTADTGGAWTVTGSGVAYAVDGSAGKMSVGIGRTGTARLSSAAHQNNDVIHDLTLEAVPTGGGLTMSTIVRATATGDYRARVKVLATGGVQISLTTVVGGTETVISPATTVAGLTYTPGTTLRVRAQASGAEPTTVQMKVWDAAGTEPAAWQRTVVDSTAGLQAPGSIGVVGFLSSSATAPLVARVDNLAATTL